MIIGYTNSQKDISVGIGYMPPRQRPCLIVKQGNQYVKYASFNNAYSAVKFMDILAEFCDFQMIDWCGDDIPLGFRADWNNWEGGADHE